MSADPSAGGGSPRSPRSSWSPRSRRPLSVRERVVLVVIASVAVASLVIGSVAVLAVRGLLLDRVDEQLERVFTRTSLVPDASGWAPSTPPSFIDGPGLGPGLLAATIVDGHVLDSAYLVADGTARTVPEAAWPALGMVSPGAGAVSVDLGAVGGYRLMALPLEGTRVVTVVGLPLAETQLTISQLIATIAALAAGVMLVAGVGAYAVSRFALRPLDRVAETAAEVSRLSLAQGEVALSVRVPAREADERTEVGRVGASINRMLGHVGEALSARQTSEAKLRRFVSDASHELRTPLASIRGYAELATRIGGPLPGDVAYSLERIGSESVRMTGIVEDLLLLARLDEGRPLERGPVDLTDLLIHAVNDAGVAGPEHPVALEIPERSVTVIGDAARLQQVVANLLANARIHTPAGTEVSVRLALAPGGEALIEVADNGPGVDPSVRDTVFERFVRADSSRSRATGASGLGLSIVAAVVAAHGGRSAVDSVPGRTVFRFWLPESPRGEPARPQSPHA